MPFALVIIGLLMIITGINNTYAQFGAQLQTDFGGSKGFLVWALALAAVGALGYIENLRTFSHYFMALILLSFILSNKGVFQNLQAALAKGPTAPQPGAPSTFTIPIQLGGSMAGQTVTPSASSATIDQAISSNQSGLFGQPASAPGQVMSGTAQGKFNSWMNYLLGIGTSSSGATP